MEQQARPVTAQPLHDRIIVKPDEQETKTEGGIFIPDTALEKPKTGTIVAAGPGLKDKPTMVKAGDRVRYSNFSGTDLDLDGIDYLIMREDEILCIL